MVRVRIRVQQFGVGLYECLLVVVQFKRLHSGQVKKSLMRVTDREHDGATVSGSGVTADAWITSSRLDNGCYGRQPLQSNSMMHAQPSAVEAGQATNCRIARVQRWPGIDTLIVAYQRYVHGN